MEKTVGKRSQTRMVKRNKIKKDKNFAWVNIVYIIIFAGIIFAMSKFV
ncbi:hypothetical protein [uncultured Clostridium sp.]|nr:hypothetical protein [uncultured Clostridium sp.]